MNAVKVAIKIILCLFCGFPAKRLLAVNDWVVRLQVGSLKELVVGLVVDLDLDLLLGRCSRALLEDPSLFLVIVLEKL